MVKKYKTLHELNFQWQIFECCFAVILSNCLGSLNLREPGGNLWLVSNFAALLKASTQRRLHACNLTPLSPLRLSGRHLVSSLSHTVSQVLTQVNIYT